MEVLEEVDGETENLEELVLSGKSAAERGCLEEAVEMISQTIELQPINPELYVLKGHYLPLLKSTEVSNLGLTGSRRKLRVEKKKDVPKSSISIVDFLPVHETFSKIDPETFDRNSISKVVGQGGSDSICYLAQHQGEDVVVKKFKTTAISNSDKQEFKIVDKFDDCVSYLRMEFECLMSLSHPNIVQFKGYVLAKKSPSHETQRGRVELVMEFCKNGDMVGYIHSNKGKIAIQQKLKWILQVASGMRYLHGVNVLFRCLKWEDVCLDRYLVCKIIDFGHSLSFRSKKDLEDREEKREIRGSFLVNNGDYDAPELQTSINNYTRKSEVYTFGIMIYNLMEEDFDPYNIVHSNGNSLKRVSQDPYFRPKFKNESSTPLWIRNIAEICWDGNPEIRPSFREIVQILKNKGKFSPAVNEVVVDGEEDTEADEQLFSYDLFPPGGDDFDPSKMDYFKRNKKLSLVNIHDIVTLELVSDGERSKVYKAIYSDTYVALKVFKVEEDCTGGDNNSIFRKYQREIELSQVFSHSRIVRSYGFVVNNHLEGPRLGLITEYCENGNLADYIKKFPDISQYQKIKWFLQICEGMEYLHSNAVVHGNICCENVCLDGNLECKIIGFSNSKAYKSREESEEEYSEVELDFGLGGLKEEKVTLRIKNHKRDVYLFGKMMSSVILKSDPTKKTPTDLPRQQKWTEEMTHFHHWIKKMILNCLSEKGDGRKEFSEIKEIIALELQKLENNEKYTSIDDSKTTKIDSMVLECYNRAIELDPRCSEAYYHRGKIMFEHQQQSDYKAAMNDFTKVIELGNHKLSSFAYHLRAKCFEQLGVEKNAEDDYQKSLELNPKFFEAIEDISLFYRKQNKVEQEISILSDFIGHSFHDGRLYRRRGRLYFQLERYGDAYDDFISSLAKVCQTGMHERDRMRSRRDLVCCVCECISKRPDDILGKLKFKTSFRNVIQKMSEEVGEIFKKIVGENTIELTKTELLEIQSSISLEFVVRYKSILYDEFFFHAYEVAEREFPNKYTDRILELSMGLFRVGDEDDDDDEVVVILKEFNPFLERELVSGVKFQKYRVKRNLLRKNDVIYTRVYVGTFNDVKKTVEEGKSTCEQYDLKTGKRLLYRGDFKDGEREGRGVLYDPKNPHWKVYEGEFVKSERCGKGVEFFHSKEFNDEEQVVMYEGAYLKNLRHGRGEEYRQKTGEIRRGNWNLGVLDPSSVFKFECPIIKYSSIQKHLHSSNIVGQGAYGVVYRVKSSVLPHNLPSKIKEKFCAVKIMKAESPYERNIIFNMTKRGIGLCNSLENSKHILRIYSIVRGSREVGYIMEICGEAIDSLISKSREIPIEMKEKIRILRETAIGMKCLHMRNVMHRDLKWPNVLTGFNDSNIRLTDFDTLKEDEDQWRLNSIAQSSRVGTQGFLAPEVFLGKKYTLKCDVFAYGMMIYALLWEKNVPYVTQFQCSCGVLLNSIFLSNSLDFHIANCSLRPLLDPKEIERFPSFLIDLMIQCWDRNPFNRPSFEEICFRFDVERQKSFIVVEFRIASHSNVVGNQKMFLVKPYEVSRVSEWVEKKFVGSKVIRFEHAVLGTIHDDEDLVKVIEKTSISSSNNRNNYTITLDVFLDAIDMDFVINSDILEGKNKVSLLEFQELESTVKKLESEKKVILEKCKDEKDSLKAQLVSSRMMYENAQKEILMLRKEVGRLLQLGGEKEGKQGNQRMMKMVKRKEKSKECEHDEECEGED